MGAGIVCAVKAKAAAQRRMFRETSLQNAPQDQLNAVITCTFARTLRGPRVKIGSTRLTTYESVPPPKSLGDGYDDDYEHDYDYGCKRDYAYDYEYDCDDDYD